MDTKTARIKFDPATGAFEVEGAEAFVRAMFDNMSSLLGERETKEPPPAEVARKPTESRSPKQTPHHAFAASFGEYLQDFAPENDIDRVLVAGRYAQHLAEDNAFKTAEVNRILKEQGIKVGNPSQAVKGNLDSKRVFIVKKGAYRVSTTGEEHLNTLRAKK